MLRTYLRESIDSIRAPGIEPEWVSAIQEHRNLLSESPCERCGRQLLQGDDSLFEEVKRRLDVGRVARPLDRHGTGTRRDRLRGCRVPWLPFPLCSPC